MFRQTLATILAALTLAPTAANSATDPRVVTVGIDHRAERLRRIYEVEAAAHQAIDYDREVQVWSSGAGFTVSISPFIDPRPVIRLVRSRFEGRPGVKVSERVGVMLTAWIKPPAWASMSDYDRGLALHDLGESLLWARLPIGGLQIETAPDGVVVTATDPSRKAGLPGWIQEGFHGSLTMQARADGSWLVRPADDMLAAMQSLSPADRAAETADWLRTYLRVPLGLPPAFGQARFDRPEEAWIVLPDQWTNKDLIEAARARVEKADGVLEATPVALVSVYLNQPASDPSGHPALDLISEADDLILPLTSITEEGDAVVVKVKSPGHKGARAARVRAAFAGRSDVVVSGSGEDLVRIALAPAAATRVGPDKLAAAVRARLARLKLNPAAVSITEDGLAHVSFPTAEEADAFRRNLRSGGEAFAVRVVDPKVDASGEPKARAAQDLRLRSVEDETLWLRPEPLITGSMLEPGEAVFAIDEDLHRQLVIFRLTPEGARVLGGVTGAIVGQRLALTSDGVILSAPVVNQQIPGSRGEITVTGRAQGEALAARMNAASDDLPLKLVEETGG